MSSPFEIEYFSTDRRRALITDTEAVWLYSREEIQEMCLEDIEHLLKRSTIVKNLVHKLAEKLKPTLLTPEQEFAIRVIDAQTKDCQRRLERLQLEL